MSLRDNLVRLIAIEGRQVGIVTAVVICARQVFPRTQAFVLGKQQWIPFATGREERVLALRQIFQDVLLASGRVEQFAPGIGFLAAYVLDGVQDVFLAEVRLEIVEHSTPGHSWKQIKQFFLAPVRNEQLIRSENVVELYLLGDPTAKSLLATVRNEVVTSLEHLLDREFPLLQGCGGNRRWLWRVRFATALRNEGKSPVRLEE